MNSGSFCRRGGAAGYAVRKNGHGVRVSKHTLNRWRVTGEGPPFIKYGPRLVRYREAALDEWARKRTRASTSEYGRESA